MAVNLTAQPNAAQPNATGPSTTGAPLSPSGVTQKIPTSTNPVNGSTIRSQTESIDERAARQIQAGNAAYRKRDFVQAVMAYRTAIRIQPTWPQAQTALGHALVAQKQYRSARLAYEAALKADSLDGHAHLGLGVLAFHQKQYVDAARHFTRAEGQLESANPEHADAFLYAGLSYLEAKQPRKAEPLLKTADVLHPHHPSTQLALSDLYRREERFFSALHHVEQALPHDRTNAQLLTNRGSLYLKLNQMDLAYENFRLALRQNPHDMNALNGAGVALLELDKIKAAAAIYDSLISRGHRTAFLYNNRGIVRIYQALQQEQQGDEHEAKQHFTRAQSDFQKAQSLDTTNKYYQNNLGNLFKNTKQYENAVKCYRAYLSKTAINNMAILYANAEKPVDSRYYFDVALKLDSGNRAFMYNKYVLYSKFYKDSLALKPDLNQAGQGVSAKTISTKYSRDGYINIYLYDYGFDAYNYPDAVILPIRPDPPMPISSETVSSSSPIVPSPAAAPPPARQGPVSVERRRMPKMKRAKHRGSTRCPTF